MDTRVLWRSVARLRLGRTWLACTIMAQNVSHPDPQHMAARVAVIMLRATAARVEGTVLPRSYAMSDSTRALDESSLVDSLVQAQKPVHCAARLDGAVIFVTCNSIKGSPLAALQDSLLSRVTKRLRSESLKGCPDEDDRSVAVRGVNESIVISEIDLQRFLREYLILQSITFDKASPDERSQGACAALRIGPPLRDVRFELRPNL